VPPVAWRNRRRVLLLLPSAIASVNLCRVGISFLESLNDDDEFDSADAIEGRPEIRATGFIGNGPQGNMNVSVGLLAIM
jgi:hypothetical protein